MAKMEWSVIIMNAGCGSGLLSKLLAQKLPRGKVYTVDIDSNMINKYESGVLQNLMARVNYQVR